MDIDIYQLLEWYSIFISSLINIVGKVQVFWENLQRCFDVTKYVMSKKMSYFFKLCGLLRLYELYKSEILDISNRESVIYVIFERIIKQRCCLAH